MRHGETDWNRDRRVMSHLPIGLNAKGIAQCHALAQALRPAGIRRIVSSPLTRARESADIVAGEIGVAVEDDPALSEVNFGAWAGHGYDDLIGRPDFQAYAQDPVGTPPPEGEALAAVQLRGLEAIQRALDVDAGGRVLVVSHGDMIRSLLCHLLAVDLAEYRRFTVDNCSVSAVDVRDGWVSVRFVNMVSDASRLWAGCAIPRLAPAGR
jgi:broad specificity phosphatase PhoE